MLFSLHARPVTLYMHLLQAAFSDVLDRYFASGPVVIFLLSIVWSAHPVHFALHLVTFLFYIQLYFILYVLAVCQYVRPGRVFKIHSSIEP